MTKRIGIRRVGKLILEERNFASQAPREFRCQLESNMCRVRMIYIWKSGFHWRRGVWTLVWHSGKSCSFD